MFRTVIFNSERQIIVNRDGFEDQWEARLWGRDMLETRENADMFRVLDDNEEIVFEESK